MSKKPSIPLPPILSYSISDLWDRNISEEVRDKMERMNYAVQKEKDDTEQGSSKS
jgi:hypothetical protein